MNKSKLNQESIDHSTKDDDKSAQSINPPKIKKWKKEQESIDFLIDSDESESEESSNSDSDQYTDASSESSKDPLKLDNS